MKIRHVVTADFRVEEWEDLGGVEKYVNKRITKLRELRKNNTFHVEDFDVPDDLDMDLIVDICTGKAFNVWMDNWCNFHKDYLQDWIFVKHKGEWLSYSSWCHIKKYVEV